MKAQKLLKAALTLSIAFFVILQSFAGCAARPLTELKITGRPENDSVVFEDGAVVELGFEYAPAAGIAEFGVVWASSDIKVAKVDKTGRVALTGLGKAEISVTAKSGGSASDSFTLTVLKAQENETPPVPELPAEKLNIVGVQDVIRVQEGAEPFVLSYALTPRNASAKVVWSSDSSKTASVSSGGKVTALRAGTAVITAAVKGLESIADSVTVIVEKKPVVMLVITGKPEYSRMVKGAAGVLKATEPSENGEVFGVEWMSSDESVAEINAQSGALSAKNTGRAVITAYKSEGVYDSFELVVYDGTAVKEDFENMTITGTSTASGTFAVSANSSSRPAISLGTSDAERPENGTGKYLKVVNISTAWAGPVFKLTHIAKNTTYRAMFDIKLLSGHPITNFQLLYKKADGTQAGSEYRSIHMVLGQSVRFSYDFNSSLDFDYVSLCIFTASDTVNASFALDNLVVDEKADFTSPYFEEFDNGLNNGAIEFTALSSGGYFSIGTTDNLGKSPFPHLSPALEITSVKGVDTRIEILSDAFAPGVYTLRFRYKVLSGSPEISAAGQSNESIVIINEKEFLFTALVTVLSDKTVQINISDGAQPLNAALTIDGFSVTPLESEAAAAGGAAL